MTALILMLTWLPQVLPAMSKLPQPVNLNLTSRHFRTMLKWEPGPGTPTGVYYNVTVIIDRGTLWVPVAGCERVQHPLVCNLTDAFTDPYQTYIVRVTALQGEQASQPASHPEFKPVRDTQLDLPLLTVTPRGRNLCVDLQPPMEHLREIYDKLSYKLAISSGADTPQVRETRSLKTQILDNLAPGRQYCVSICFWDRLEDKNSNYSQPVCAFTPGVFTADLWISAVLCAPVIFGVAVMVFLFYTGFISLKKRPLPPVLTSINHVEDIQIIAPCNTSLSSLLTVKATLPSSGENKYKQSSSDESDGESETESTGGAYQQRGGTNLMSSSSSSSSAPLSPEPEPHLSLSSDQTSDSAETHSSAALNHTLSTHTDTDRGAVHEEEEVVGDGGSQDVNLLTLTFGRQEEEEEEQESQLVVAEVEPEAPSVNSITSLQPSQTGDTRKVAIKTVSCFADEEEEEEEDSGYMGRPCTDVLQRLL